MYLMLFFCFFIRLKKFFSILFCILIIGFRIKVFFFFFVVRWSCFLFLIKLFKGSIWWFFCGIFEFLVLLFFFVFFDYFLVT